jgi:lipid II:glycine glycyltransferase (peptidoglycan interpeptide bridge formation enzyme)
VVDTEKSRAMLLLSASHFRDFADSATRQSLGRANRCLCWKDMISFKNSGFRVYDFGGLPQDEADQELQQIGSFKRGFGGREVVEYSGPRGITLLGKLACLIKR